MSDVSGIPYMGPMGQGNFFASPYPALSGGGNMSAGQISAPYMPEIYNNQNVVNNLWASGGGFGQLTNYYSQLGANQLSGIGSLNPYGVFGGGGGGGGASPYQTSSSVWDTGASPFQGGGGSSGFGGSIYDFSGGLGSLGASPYQTTPNVFDTGSRGFQYPGAGAIDWGGLFQTAQQSGMSPGMLSGLGGLGGAPYTPQPSSSLDWSTLFGGGGGARADPYPGMSMPGGLSSAMTAREPAYDYGSLFKGGGAGADPYPGMAMPGGLNAPMTTPQRPAVDPYPNMAMPGGLGSPMTAEARPDFNTSFEQRAGGLGGMFDTGAAPLTGTQDMGPYGGGAGIGGLDTGRAIGAPYTPAAEPQRGMLGPPVTEAYNPYFNVTGGEGAGPPTDTRTGGALAPGGGLTATDLSEQARARLAELMSGPKELSPDEVFAGDRPVPTEGQPTSPDVATAQAPAAGDMSTVQSPANAYDAFQKGWENVGGGAFDRPSAAEFQQGRAEPTDYSLTGRQDALATLKQELQASNLIMTSGYRDPTDPLSRANPASAHSQGRAFDVRAHTPEQADAAISQIHELLGARGLEVGRDYRIIDEVRHPSGWATGPHVHTQFTEAGMQRYQREVYQDPNPARPPADIPYPNGVPLPADRPDAAGQRPAEAAAPPLPAEGPATQSYPGADVPRPPMDIPDPRVVGGGFNALDAAAPPSGVQKAQSFLNRSLESILQQHSPENLGKAGFVMDLKQPLREALKGPFGGQILSGLQPKLGSLGLTQSDFTKAVADPRARFGGEFGGVAGGELPSVGSFTPFEGFRQSSDFENRSAEQLGRDQLAELQARGISYAPGPEGAPTPLGNALGLGNLPVPQFGVWGRVPLPAAGGASSAFDPTTFQSPANDYGMFQQPAPQWQTSIPQGRSTPDLINAIYKGAGDTGLNPAVLSQVFGLESNYDPRSVTKGNYGLPQLSADMWADAPFRGTMGGLTFEQFKNATPEQQIGAYVDFLNRSGALTRGGLDPASMSPETQFAYLMANQIGGHNNMVWRNALAGGDMFTPVATSKQADELGNKSIGAMEETYRQRAARW